MEDDVAEYACRQVALTIIPSFKRAILITPSKMVHDQTPVVLLVFKAVHGNNKACKVGLHNMYIKPEAPRSL